MSPQTMPPPGPTCPQCAEEGYTLAGRLVMQAELRPSVPLPPEPDLPGWRSALYRCPRGHSWSESRISRRTP